MGLGEERKRKRIWCVLDGVGLSYCISGPGFSDDVGMGNE